MSDFECSICKQPVSPWLRVPRDWHRPRETAAFHVYWCKGCDFGCLLPTPDREEIAKYYDIDEYYTHRPDQQLGKPETALPFLHRLLMHLAWRADRGSNDIVRSLSTRARARICDMGCGNGSTLVSLREAGHTVLGVEPDEAARQRALARGLEVFPGTAEALPAGLRGEKFDAVLMRHVLEHCVDPVLAVKNVRRLLHPDGVVVLETPNNAAQGRLQVGRAWFHLDVPRHLGFFTAKSLCGICEEAGLRVERTEFTGYCRQFSQNWIATEQRIWDLFRSCSDEAAPVRNSPGRAWRLFLRTALARPERKYDSVRVWAQG